MSKIRKFIYVGKDLKQRKGIRRTIALILFPLAYIGSYIHRYYGFTLLIKIFMTDLKIFDRIAAWRLRKLIAPALSYYYLSSPEYLGDDEDSTEYEAEYMVLKRYVNKREKGVISIHWRWQVDIFVRNYMLNEILERYILIMGPDCFGSEWTFPFLAAMHKGQERKGKVFTAARDNCIKERLSLMGFETIPYGISSDFVNPEIFSDKNNYNKEIDVIMVANWNYPIKRHYVLFKALEKIRCELNVVFIGFPSGGHTLKEIRDIEGDYNIKRHKISYYENLCSSSVNVLLNNAKTSVNTSLMEGGNRACFESFFANTPSIILTEGMGVPKEYFNIKTGMISKERKLHIAIEYMVKNYREFSPRDWAIKNISPKITKDKMNAFLKESAINDGMKWSFDIVGKQWMGQTFEYISEDAKYTFQDDYEFIRRCYKK